MNTAQRRNTDPNFIGITGLKQAQAKQLVDFEHWASESNWQAIHMAHYDWWMFPIDEGSAHGQKYVVYPGDIVILKQDPEYLRNYLRGVELLALAWGWDLAQCQAIAQPQPGQAWSRLPIRLYKAARSLQLFGCTDQFESLKALALNLIAQGESLRYGNSDLAVLFTEGRPRR